MYDVIFYTDGYADPGKFKALKEKFIFLKHVVYKDSILKTASKAKDLCNTKFFWLINVNNNFLDSMLDFKVDTWDQQYVHVFKLQENSECYLVPRNINIDETKSYFDPVKYNNEYEVSDISSDNKSYDIFFLSYGEPNSDKNWKVLSSKFPSAVRVYGKENIYQSHRLAALSSSTEYFWVVDGDNEILENFNFSFYIQDYDFDLVHIWYSRNEINGLEYGNGGIKLFPKFLFDGEVDAVDITTSLSNRIKIIPTVASINRFASSPWNAWRSAFRECVKLSSGIIDRSVQSENIERLKAWTTIGLDKKFGEYVIPGALSGVRYGLEHKGNKQALGKINDWNWLHEKFQAEIKLPYRPE